MFSNVTTAAELKAVHNNRAAAPLAAPTAAFLNDTSTERSSGARLASARQLLAEGMATVYEDRDNAYAGLMEWHNKAMWLVVIAVLLIALLGLVFHREELFLVGAAGGLMSRLARSLFRADVPTDYGAPKTTLFLSPLLGAIAAWFGVLLLILLTHLKVLGEAFSSVGWHPASMYSPLVMNLALVLGFSERFFLSLLAAVENRVGTDVSKAAPSSGGASHR